MKFDELVVVARGIIDFKDDGSNFQCFPATDQQIKALAKFVLEYKKNLQQAPIVYLLNTINDSKLNMVWLNRPIDKYTHKALIWNIEEVKG